MKRSNLMSLRTMGVVVVCLTLGATEGYSGPIFYTTSDASQWQVATKAGGTDGSFSSFPTTGFVTATALNRFTGTTEWIANNSSGNNAPAPVFFVFRQTFDLTGYNPATADLQFQWAADDSGQGFANRGTWTPKFSVNGGALINGTWAGGNTYSFGPTQDVSSGFVSGQNEIEFYVEGNGATDGFALNTIGFTASAPAVPEPASLTLFGIAAASGLGYFGLRRWIGHRG
jgi:PEP-CTERM motif